MLALSLTANNARAQIHAGYDHEMPPLVDRPPISHSPPSIFFNFSNLPPPSSTSAFVSNSTSASVKGLDVDGSEGDMPPLVERPRGQMEYTFINTSDNDTQHVNDGSYISNNNNNTNYNQQQPHNASQAPLTIATPARDASSHGYGYAYGQFEVITSNNTYSPSPSNHNNVYSLPASSSMLTLSPSTPGATSSFSEFYASPSPQVMSPVSPDREHASPSFAFAVPAPQVQQNMTTRSPALVALSPQPQPQPQPPTTTSATTPSSSPSNPNPQSTETQTQTQTPATQTSATTSRPRPRTKKPPRDDGYIPRPPNAFIIFRSSFIKSRAIPGRIEGRHSSLSKICGHVWKKLPAHERAIWDAKAADALEAHRARYPHWRFSPGDNKAAAALSMSMSISMSGSGSMGGNGKGGEGGGENGQQGEWDWGGVGVDEGNSSNSATGRGKGKGKGGKAKGAKSAKGKGKKRKRGEEVEAYTDAHHADDADAENGEDEEENARARTRVRKDDGATADVEPSMEIETSSPAPETPSVDDVHAHAHAHAHAHSATSLPPALTTKLPTHSHTHNKSNQHSNSPTAASTAASHTRRDERCEQIASLIHSGLTGGELERAIREWEVERDGGVVEVDGVDEEVNETREVKRVKREARSESPSVDLESNANANAQAQDEVQVQDEQAHERVQIHDQIPEAQAQVPLTAMYMRRGSVGGGIQEQVPLYGNGPMQMQAGQVGQSQMYAQGYMWNEIPQHNSYATNQPYATQAAATPYVQVQAQDTTRPPLSTYSTLTGWAGQASSPAPATTSATMQQGAYDTATYANTNANSNTAFFSPDASSSSSAFGNATDAAFALANATADAAQYANARPSMTPDLYYSASSPEDSSPEPFPYPPFTAPSSANGYQGQWGAEPCSSQSHGQYGYGYGYGMQGEGQVGNDVWGNGVGYSGMQGYEGEVDGPYGHGAYQLDAGWGM